ncbi:MAG: aminotransferase class IV [Spirochaetales bacterium]|nr:aminotransferase class IV [Spirochaetales bacterium]
MENNILYNGRITPDSIVTHTGSSFFNYGIGFFETVLYQNNRLYFWADHVERLQQTAELFEFLLTSEWLSEDLVYELIRHNKGEQNILRVKILCGPIREQGVWDIIIFVKEYERHTMDYELFIHWEPKDGFFCNFKSVNYQALLYWRGYYKEHFQADEVLFLNYQGNILEASASNVLVVKDSVLFYVDIHDNYLPGIMQKNIVKESTHLGFKKAVPIQGGFTLDFLEKADEVLLTNSLIVAQRTGQLHGSKNKKTFFYRDSGCVRRIQEYFLDFLHPNE